MADALPVRPPVSPAAESKPPDMDVSADAATTGSFAAAPASVDASAVASAVASASTSAPVGDADDDATTRPVRPAAKTAKSAKAGTKGGTGAAHVTAPVPTTAATSVVAPADSRAAEPAAPLTRAEPAPVGTPSGIVPDTKHGTLNTASSGEFARAGTESPQIAAATVKSERTADRASTPVLRERSMSSVRYAHPGVDTSRLRRSFFATPPEQNVRTYIPLEDRMRDRDRSRSRDLDEAYASDHRKDRARMAMYTTASRFYRTPSPERA